MNLAEPFIRRPVMTTLVMLALMVFGLAAWRFLAVSDLPNVDFPTIVVTASLPGASPETMGSSVATPLEKQFSTIAGITSMSSTSRQGVSSIVLQFDLSRSLDSAALDVQSAISVAQRQLPNEMPSPPSFQKVNPADQPILYLALTSDTMPLSQLDEYGETTMAQRISTAPGVAQVAVYGSQKYAVRAELDPVKLAYRDLGLDEVVQAIQGANVNLPTGTLEGPTQSWTVQATGQLRDASAFGKLIVAWKNGSPVRLADLARVSDSVENDRTAAWVRDHRGIVLAVQRQPGTNTIAVASAVKALLPQLAREIPPSVQTTILYDRSESIRASVADVEWTLLLTLALVVGVIFLFLRDARATTIPSLALPMSIIGTFAVMYLLGYSLDNLSLMALTLSVGFVVDDAIVVLENIVRHREMGKPPMQAALDGSREISFTIVSMTISLAAVFIPVLLLGGIVGRLFHEFAVVIGVAILISGVVSLSLTPMLSSRFLAAHGGRRGRFYLASERVFDRARDVYAAGLRWSLRHRVVVLVATILFTVAMLPLFAVIPKGFLPTEDTGQLIAFTEAAEGTSFADLAAHQVRVADVIGRDPNVETFMSTAGLRGFLAANTGILFIRLKPRNQRPLSADEVIAELRPKLAVIPGIQTYLQNPPPIPVGGMLSKAEYQYTLQDANTVELYRAAPALEQKLKTLPGLTDVTSDLEIRNPEATVRLDRAKAASLGISPQQVEDALYTAYGERQVSTIYTPTNEYQVIAQLLPEFAGDPSALSLLHVRAPSGQTVPLPALAQVERGVGPLSVNHVGQLPSVTLSFNLKPGSSIGTATAAVSREARAMLPAGVAASFQGAAQAFQSSLAGLGFLLVLTVIVIYLVLGILYESFIHPFTILSALPLAGFGALVTLLVFHSELSLYAFVGIIMLVGLVKKNGIMMVDFAVIAEREGKSAVDAIYDASLVRFRPIMMTTMAALMGTLPIAIGFGAGAEARRPLGLAVVGGLLFSQTLTLFVTPVIYTWMDDLQRWAGRRLATRRRRHAEAHP